MKFLVPISIFLLFTLQYSNGQVIAAYSGTETPTTSVTPGVSAVALSAGIGLTTQLSSGFFNYQKWTTAATPDLTDYFEWELTSDSDFTAILNTINLSYNAGNKAPETLELRTSLDNFSTSIYTTTINANSTSILVIPINLTTSIGGTITFRLYGYNSTNANASRFGIDGGLNNQIGLDNTGITIEGTLIYNGLFYDGNSWTPFPPNSTTGSLNAIVGSGNYNIITDVIINNLEIRPTSTLTITEGNSISVNGDLTVNGILELNSDSNNYSSLIVEGDVNGNVVYKRHVNNTASAGENDANDLIAPPVSGESFNNFLSNNSNIVSNTSNTLFLFGPFNKTSGTYITYSNTETATLDAATGYRAASTDSGTFTFTGIVNTNSVSKPIFNSGPAFQEWNLIGNPYPSYIKLSDFLSSNNSEFDAPSAGIYGYDGDASDGWTIWNLAYLDLHPDAVITPGQGFLVASKEGGGTITFNPNMRTVGNSDDFIAGRPSQTITSTYLKLTLSNNTKSYNTDFYFNENASSGLDIGYDARILGNVPPNLSIYSHLIENNEGMAMAIQSLSNSDLGNIHIPLGVNANQGQQITINISENTLPNSINIYLEDNVTNTFTLLNSGNYNIIPSENLNGTGRFFLNITDTSLSSYNNSLDKLNIYYRETEKIIVVSGVLQDKTNAKVYDFQGRCVSQTILNTQDRVHDVDVNTLSNGVYIVQLSNNRQTLTKKIILK